MTIYEGPIYNYVNSESHFAVLGPVGNQLRLTLFQNDGTEVGSVIIEETPITLLGMVGDKCYVNIGNVVTEDFGNTYYLEVGQNELADCVDVDMINAQGYGIKANHLIALNNGSDFGKLVDIEFVTRLNNDMTILGYDRNNDERINLGMDLSINVREFGPSQRLWGIFNNQIISTNGFKNATVRAVRLDGGSSFTYDPASRITNDHTILDGPILVTSWTRQLINFRRRTTFLYSLITGNNIDLTQLMENRGMIAANEGVKQATRIVGNEWMLLIVQDDVNNVRLITEVIN